MKPKTAAAMLAALLDGKVRMTQETATLLPELVPTAPVIKRWRKNMVVVCNRVGTATPLKGNVFGQCHDCRHGIYHRPDVPAKAMKVCVDCFADRYQGGKA